MPTCSKCGKWGCGLKGVFDHRTAKFTCKSCKNKESGGSK